MKIKIKSFMRVLAIIAIVWMASLLVYFTWVAFQLYFGEWTIPEAM